jgi:pimeloyl-ACP methyl ester carboxylesterase
MIQDFPASDKPLWRLIGQEALAYLAAAALHPFGIRDSPRRTPRRQHQRTVVVVHGLGGNRSTLFPLAAYLRHRGHRQVLSFNYRGGDGIERSARALKQYLRRHVRGGRLDLVGHSLGGLVARVYIEQLGGARRVDRCVTLGAPHRGTYNAYWLGSRLGAQLRPDSPLFRRLDGSGAATPGVRFLSIVAGSDNLVIPRVFAGHEQSVRVPDLGHVAMLFSPQVLRLVGDFLGQAR